MSDVATVIWVLIMVAHWPLLIVATIELRRTTKLLAETANLMAKSEPFQ